MHKPNVVEAMQFDGTHLGFEKIMRWAGNAPIVCLCPEYILEIDSFVGICKVRKDDWVIRGVRGEFYGCSNESFVLNYDLCSEDLNEKQAKPKKQKK